MSSNDIKIYLLYCSLNRIRPNEDLLTNIDFDELFHFYKYQCLDSLVYPLIKNLKPDNFDSWESNFNLNVRNLTLFEEERKQLFEFMSDNNIWFAPLKGIVLKDYYPHEYARIMSDNDILFDMSKSQEVIDYFVKKAYTPIKYNTDKRHLCFHKKPCFNFELHKQLFVDYGNEYLFYKFFKDVNNRLCGDACFKSLSKEDFYLYILCHYRRHFLITGSGLRPIIDIFVFLKNNTLNWNYINSSLKALNLTNFESINKSLAFKLFDHPDGLIGLTNDEKAILDVAFSNTPNGSISFLLNSKVEETINNDVKINKLLFPNLDHMQYHGLKHAKYKIFIPIYWIQYNYRRIKTYGFSNSVSSIKKILKSKKR